MLTSLLSFQISTVRKFFETKTLAKTITTLLFLVVFYVVVSALYFFLVTGLRFTLFQMEKETRDALLYFIFESFYLTLFLLTALSSGITILFALFKKKKEEWFLSTPNYNYYTHITFFRVLLGAIIPTFILFVPMTMALHKVITLSPFAVAKLYLALALLVTATTALFVTLILALGKGLLVLKKKALKQSLTFNELAITYAILLTGFCLYGATSLRHVDLPALFKINAESDALDPSVIGHVFSWSPSHITATDLFCATTKNISCQKDMFLSLLVLTFLALIFSHLASRFHFSLWKSFQEKTSRSLFKKTPSHAKSYFNHSGLRSTFERESLGVTRDMKSFLWLLFLMTLWVGEVLIHTIAKHTYIKHGINFIEYIPRLSATQAMITVYFVSAFTLRFVYPSFSVEKKMTWILGTSPLSITKRYLAKLFFYTTLFLTLGVVMCLVSVSLLSFEGETTLRNMLMIIPSTLLVTTFGLSLGIFFPSSDEDDAESATTSMPGLIFTFLSLAYGALGTYILFFSETSKMSLFLYLYAFLTVTGATLIHVFTYKRLQKK